jgi:hypothetical protein
MPPIAVIPMNDPDGILFPHLKVITPLLKDIFSQIFVSVNAATQQALPAYIAWLQADDFFRVTYHETDPPVGEDFLALYRDAASACAPDHVLHLCFIDRTAFALQSEHHLSFTADIQAVTPNQTPLIFQRSERAWQTHPRNYREAEHMVTKAGELLFGSSLDFAWCHLVIQANQLLKVIPTVKNRDLSFCAEIVLAVREEVHTKEVDWLAWEDPFIHSADPQEIKMARETSMDENLKRLGYVIPMLQLLVAAKATG